MAAILCWGVESKLVLMITADNPHRSNKIVRSIPSRDNLANNQCPMWPSVGLYVHYCGMTIKALVYMPLIPVSHAT